MTLKQEPEASPQASGFGTLGYGTASLASRVSLRDSKRLLESAFDAGLTHFDTARSYGFGDAELALGHFLAGKREHVTVTTKVGIRPPRRSGQLLLAKALARQAVALAPGVRSLFRRGAGKLVEHECFGTDAMRLNLETSLRQLRTEYVDVLLLHEPSLDTLATEEPWTFLQEARRTGKARHIGLAVTAELAPQALQMAPFQLGVLQVPWRTGNIGSAAPQGKFVCLFVHSVLGARMVEVRSRLRKLEAQRPSVVQELLLTPGLLERVALRQAMDDPHVSTVLFSSLRRDHVQSNAAAVTATASVEQLETLKEAMRPGRADETGHTPAPV